MRLTGRMRILFFLLIVAECFYASVSSAATRDLSQAIARNRYEAFSLVLLAEAIPAPESASVPVRKRSSPSTAVWLQRVAASFADEGGFSLDVIAKTLGRKNDRQAHIAKAFRQLSYLRHQQTQPNSSKTHSPPNNPIAVDPLLLSAVCAVAYAVPSEAGERAAAQCAWLVDDDPQAADYSRVIYALVAAELSGVRDRERILFRAARRATAGRIARSILRVQEMKWRDLPTETTLAGRVQRVIYLWLASPDFASAIQNAHGKLVRPDSRRLLLALCAARCGRAALPEAWLSRTLRQPGIAMLTTRTFDLAASGILLPIPARPVATESTSPLAAASSKSDTAARPVAAPAPAVSLTNPARPAILFRPIKWPQPSAAAGVLRAFPPQHFLQRNKTRETFSPLPIPPQNQ